MPKAVSDAKETSRFDLETCPEGFVELRKLSYGETLNRREITMRMYMRGGNRSQRRGNQPDDDSISMEVLHERLQVFDFQKSIVDHNLEDLDGRQLDFRRKEDILKLDPNIAQEIERVINELNGREGTVEPHPLAENENSPFGTLSTDGQ